MIASVVIHSHLRTMPLPESYIGLTGLIEIRDYLLTYFWMSVAEIILFGIFMIMLCLMLIYAQEKRRVLEILKRCAMIIFVSVIVLGLPREIQRNKFDWQMTQNQYHGTLLMRTYALLKDIEQDLKENTVRTVNCIPESTSQNFKYHVDGGKSSGYDVDVLEYSLYHAKENYLSQISQKDYIKINENFCGYISHEFELYTHSGFLASVDNSTKIEIPDYENLFTIKFENNTIYRTTHPEEENFKTLFLITVMDNKQEQCDALNWTEKAFPFSYDAKNEKYISSLEKFIREDNVS